MMNNGCCLVIVVAIIGGAAAAKIQGQVSVDTELSRLLGRCGNGAHGSDVDVGVEAGSAAFDACMKDVFNDARAYFPTGVPAYHIRPFDPHHADYIELRRGDQRAGIGGFKLILRNVSEYGWTNSEVTKYRSDAANRRIFYTQYFPEKSLEGRYEFAGKLLGTALQRKGYWNMTLYDYSQTTSVRRLGDAGALLKVHVEVDRIGGLRMHISDFLGAGRARLNSVADGVINSMWMVGWPIIKPIINELVSTAFTDIFNESFRFFPFEKFLS